MDKKAVIFEILPNGRRRVKIKKEKYGGTMSPKIMGKDYQPAWKTESFSVNDKYVILIQARRGVI